MYICWHIIFNCSICYSGSTLNRIKISDVFSLNFMLLTGQSHHYYLSVYIKELPEVKSWFL